MHTSTDFFVEKYFLWRWNGVSYHQLRTVCRVSGTATKQSQIVGDGVVVIIQLEAQANLRQATVDVEFVDVEFASRQVNAVDIVDRCNNKWPIAGRANCLEVCSLQGRCAKGPIFNISHETLEDTDRVAPANDDALLDFERHPANFRVIGDGASHEGENTAVLAFSCVIPQIEGSCGAVKGFANATGFSGFKYPAILCCN